ncbi:hypothetical protein AMAG_06018 [Allomyces macrogynus ATCC 38327]|uniref:GRIP domain-containing protein n=1 Tax=Allomyces macrogynus (strain ATCC 38327) TaxID=578462 RepID=A0A0L0SDL1_ALLM3|nr:hypothetical protein AMAG_06018 [Allomyces macrogynus ATCC 38327]|eukprot:KNE60643.1 hypothetical protein AMAG_06018 [Allomyces macrogynus ATCC 38327]
MGSGTCGRRSANCACNLRQYRSKDEENGERLRIMETQMRALAEESQEVGPLRAHVALLNDQFGEATARLTAAQDQLAAADADRAQLSHLRTQIAQQQAAVADLEHAVRDAQASRDRAAAEAADAVAAARRSADELATSKALFAAKARDHEAARARALELEARLDDERRELAAAVAEAESAAADAAALARNAEDRAAELAADMAAAHASIEEAKRSADRARTDLRRVQDEANAARAEVAAAHARIAALEKAAADRDAAERARQALTEQVADVQALNERLATDLEALASRETHLKHVNRSLKDEVRKLSRANSATSMPPVSPSPSANGAGLAATAMPPGAGARRMSVASTASGSMPLDLDNPGVKPVNVLYLKSVIMSFLEKKAMRPQLVPVLHALLECSDDELQRLQAIG